MKALFIVFTAVNVLRMAHVHIREGVADWYWTADPDKRHGMLANKESTQPSAHRQKEVGAQTKDMAC